VKRARGGSKGAKKRKTAIAKRAPAMLDVERARELLRTCNDVDRIIEIRDAAKFTAEYHRLRGAGVDSVNDALEIVLRAQRRFGEFLLESGRPQGRPSKKVATATFSLKSLGVDKREASRCKKLGSADEDIFEEHLVTVRAKGAKLTTSGAIAATSDAAGYDGDEWYTPAKYVELVRKVLGEIDLDPASNATAQQTVRAKKYYTKEDDARTKVWEGRTFLNPPYSQPLVEQFTDRFVVCFDSGAIPSGIVLVNNATDTSWCQALLRRCVACFTDGRIPFERAPGKPVKGTRQGQIFFYLGPEPELFANVFADAGAVLAGDVA
jgi:hypothetical protein